MNGPTQPEPPPGASSPLAADNTPPPTIPDHELMRRIGGGSYGEVWLARNVLGEFRAVKVVYRRTFNHDRPYEREFEGIKKYEPVSRTHDSQVDILHVGRDDKAGYFYYVMELADDARPIPNDECRNPKEARNPNNKSDVVASNPRSSACGIPSSFDIRNSDLYIPHTLKHELQQRGRLPFEDCVQIGLALTTALDHLHKHDLVHRDVKPSNIIFINGIPKLADIGLVADIGEAKSLVGTEGYMAPEGPGTPQADLYSLGKVLYEISIGRKGQVFPELPPDWDVLAEKKSLLELNEVILKACQADLRIRYQSAREMHADLALLQSGKSVKRLRVVERRLTIATRLGLITAGLLVVAALAYVFAVTQARRAVKARTVAEQLLYAADVNLAQQALEAGNLVRATSLLVAHRPGSFLHSTLNSQPSTSSDDLRGFEWYYLKNLCRADETHTFRGHTQAVQSVAISPNGRLLASASDDQTIRLWDSDSKSNLATLRGHRGAVNTVAFSPDGTKLASGGADNTVKLWDIANWEVITELTNHDAAVTAVAFSPDGKLLTVGTGCAGPKLWNLATGQEVREFAMTNHPETYAAAISLDGQWLAISGTGTNGLRVNLFNLLSFQPGPELYEEAGRTWGLAFSPDSRFLATAKSDGVLLWDLTTMRVVGKKLRGHEEGVRSVVFSRDGEWIGTASSDNTVRLWNFASRALVRTFKGHTDAVVSLVFSPDDRMLISASEDRTVKLWDLCSKDETNVLRGHTDAVQFVAFSPDDRILASASADSTIKLWDVNHETNAATLSGHTGPVTGVGFSNDGSTLISCSVDQTIRLWDVALRTPLASILAGQKLASLALSPDGRTIAVGSGWWGQVVSPGEVGFWDLASRQRLATSVPVHAMVRCLSFSPDGKTLAVGTADDTLELVDVASKRSIFFSANLSLGAAWAPQSQALFVSDPDRIALFDGATLRITTQLQAPSAVAHSLACSPDEKTLAVFFATTKIKLYHTATGREMATLQGHETFGLNLVFSHNGQVLASASNDKTIRLWRAPTNEVELPTPNLGANR